MTAATAVTEKLDRLAEALLNRAGGEKPVVLFPHVGVDGDALGSSLALRAVLRGASVPCVVLIDEQVPADLRFVPGHERAVCYDEADERFAPDRISLAVAFDCHEPSRLGRRRQLFERVADQAALDHHVPSDQAERDLFVVRESASSTGELVYELAGQIGALLGRDLFERDSAVQLLVGIVSDTGGFSYSNTTPAALRATADLLRFDPDLPRIHYELFDKISLSTLCVKGEIYTRVKADAGGRILSSTVPQSVLMQYDSDDYALNTIPSDLRKVDGASVIFLLRETKEPGEIRVNIRSDESLNAAALAQEFGGGGHARAAGLTLRDMSLETARTLLVERAAAILATP